MAEYPLIGACSDEEKAAVLDAVLTLRPEIAADAERLARAVLDGADSGDIADEVIDVLKPLTEPGPGGTPPPNPAELVDGLLEPYYTAIDRRVGAGLDGAAVTIALGVMAGLYEYRDIAHYDPFEAVENLEALLGKHGLELAPDDYAAHLPEWAPSQEGGDDTSEGA